MFSYRHSFHAGNHADVLKHSILIATLRHLHGKDTALTLIDTHAGPGLYRLDDDHARTSGEAQAGILQLHHAARQHGNPAPLIADYLEQIAAFNPDDPTAPPRHYPGSPFLAHHLLRPQDRLKLFELHPTDREQLSRNIAALRAGRQIAVLHQDGFDGSKAFLPPPSRRGLLLCDPSYELKTDYARVHTLLDDALKRFATGTYLCWYPLIARPEARALPQQLQRLAERHQRDWLHTTLRIRADGNGLAASGLFLINPPYTLRPALAAALPQLTDWLGQDRHAAWQLDGHAR